MNDVEAKVIFLSHYVETVAVASKAIADDHVARVFGRALFLGLDGFLMFAPALKNSMRKAAKLTDMEATEIKVKIEKLRSDYEGYYATLRDKVGAHQQEVTLDRLFEVWNDIDTTTLSIFAEDVGVIFAMLSKGGLTVSFSRPKGLASGELGKAFAGIVPSPGSPFRVGIDRVALTRPQTVGILSSHPTQEKGQRIVGGFDNLRLLIDQVEGVSQQYDLAEKALADLVVVDLCSIVDNMFLDRPADKNSGPDPSLLTQWTKDGFGGAPILQNFARDHILENQLREVRNKVSTPRC
jgi:hypothetical protein